MTQYYDNNKVSFQRITSIFFLLYKGLFMNVEKQTISPLKRVIVAMSAGNRPTSRELLDDDGLEFIFGLGKEGLTPLERSLAGKKAGDLVTIQMNRKEAAEFFGHLLICPESLKSRSNRFYMNLKICGVETATPREVVRAMASTTSCGANCACGCQCG